MKAHRVQQGEDMISISLKYGILDWEAVYNHKANDRLRKYRPDPMSLCPRDIVIIPDTQPITYNLATDQKHTISIPLPKTLFKMQVRDDTGEPIKEAKYEMTYDKTTLPGTTDGSGFVEEKIPYAVKNVMLSIWPDKDQAEQYLQYDLKIGDLNPGDDIAGTQARLGNLGLESGKTDSDYGPVTHASAERLKNVYGTKEKYHVDLLNQMTKNEK